MAAIRRELTSVDLKKGKDLVRASVGKLTSEYVVLRKTTS
jgi:hypothetical protein